MADYPEFEDILIEALASVGVPVLTFKRLDEPLPFIHVRRIDGGEDSDEITDVAVLRVDCWHHTRAQSQALKRQVRKLVARLTNTSWPSGDIDTAREIRGYVQAPSPDPDDRKQTATFELTAREQ